MYNKKYERDYINTRTACKPYKDFRHWHSAWCGWWRNYFKSFNWNRKEIELLFISCQLFYCRKFACINCWWYGTFNLPINFYAEKNRHGCLCCKNKRRSNFWVKEKTFWLCSVRFILAGCRRRLRAHQNGK